ncbi:MAG: HIT family protein [Methanophagales archaeon]|nr:HIT family protein [Methanophagales archaeon]
MGCVFCEIVEGGLKAERIYETEGVLAFLDINPRAPGHSLVIPKKHVSLLADLEDELVAELFIATRETLKILKKALNPDGFNIGINEGKAAGQEIPHLHVNVFPRFRGDGGKPVHSVVNNPPENISEIADKIRSSLKE